MGSQSDTPLPPFTHPHPAAYPDNTPVNPTPHASHLCQEHDGKDNRLGSNQPRFQGICSNRSRPQGPSAKAEFEPRPLVLGTK